MEIGKFGNDKDGQIVDPAIEVTGVRRVLSGGGMIVFFVCLLLFLPFINKAFHIDDYAFISYAQMIGWNPLHAFPRDFDYAGNVLPNFLPYEMTHPPLVPYVIKSVIALFGENEIALHLAFMIFPLIALFSLMKLNKVFFPNSRFSAVILAVFFCSLPAFLVNAQNIMTDVPTLSFLLLAMAGFFDGFETGSRKMTYLGSAALTLTIFTSYQMIVFVPLLFLYALWRRKLNLHVVVAIIFPVLVLLAWLLAIYAKYDFFPVIKSKMAGVEGNVAGEIRKGLSPVTMIQKVFATFAFIGAAMLWIVPLHFALKKAVTRFLYLFVPIAVVSFLATFKLTNYHLSSKLFFSALVALGILTLITLVWEYRQRARCKETNHEVFLLVWVFCVIGYCIALLPHSSARYLLPAFPPMLMLLMRDPVWTLDSRIRRAGIVCSLCGAILFALASSYSDYKFAETYRDFAVKTREVRTSGGNAFDVWYVGEWGMHYYMDKATARYLHKDSNEPKPGDIIVLPKMPAVWQFSPQVRGRVMLSGEEVYRSWLPLRLFNIWSHTGFYAHFWGLLPFAVSTEPDEVFRIYQVVN
jgi:dolichyl-phosphate-mannose-protein mannosyltransferase